MRAEGHLDRFAGQVVIAVVCALTAAIWEGTHQAAMSAYSSVAVSVWKLALAAVIGAVGGLLLVPGSLFTFELVRYPLSRYRDAWEARPGRTMADEVLFELVCKVHPPVEVSTLGYMEFRVKDSSEASLRLLDGELDANPGKVVAWCKLKPCPGAYEARWYASTKRRKLYEITRIKAEIAS